MGVRLVGILLGAVVCAVSIAGPAQADNIYVSVKGTKQGQFKGDALRQNLPDKMVARKFFYEVTSPRDAATGMVSAKRQHKPVVITKEWSAASPQLFQALVGSEPLTEVLIDFVGTDPKSGQEVLTHRIRLTNAAVTNIVHIMEEPGSAGAAGTAKHATGIGQPHLEQISFSFQRIDLEDLIGKTAAADDARAVK
jgi:type VI secretion system secreted protein Hcp